MIKKKSLIFTLILCLVMLPTMLLLSGCTAKITGISVYIDGREYTATSSDNTFTINFGETIDWDNDFEVKINYDDNSQEVLSKKTGDSDGYALTGEIVSLSRPSAGTYNLKITYEDYSEITIKIIVGKATVSPQISAVNAVYGENIVLPEVVGNAHNAPVTYYYNSTNTIAGATALTESTRLNAGNYYIFATLGATENYNSVNTNFANLSISKVSLTKPTLTGTYSFNGAEQTATLNNFDSATMNVTGNKKTNAGTTNIIVSLKDSTNYEWADKTNANLEISWSMAKASEKTPSSTPSALTGQYHPTKKLSDYSLPENFYWVNPNVVPTCDVTLYGAYYNENTANYENYNLNITLNLTKAELVLSSIDSLTKKYDGEPVSTNPNFTLFGKNTGVPEWFEITEQITPTYYYKLFSESASDYTTTVPSAVGAYHVKVVIPDQTNYVGLANEFTFSIQALDRTVTIDKDLNKVYDGTAVSITKADLTYVGGGDIYVQYKAKNDPNTSFVTTAPTNAGEWTVQVAVYANNNYAFVTTKKDFTISKVSLTKPTLTGTYSFNGAEQTATLENFDSATMNITGNKKTNFGTTQIIVSLKDNVNYEWADKTIENIEIDWTIENSNITLTVVNGTITGHSSPYTASYNTSVQVVAATAAAGKNFTGWSDGENIVSTNLTYTFNLTKNITLTAIYESSILERLGLQYVNRLKNIQFDMWYQTPNLLVAQGTSMTKQEFDVLVNNVNGNLGSWGGSRVNTVTDENSIKDEKGNYLPVGTDYYSSYYNNTSSKTIYTLTGYKLANATNVHLSTLTVTPYETPFVVDKSGFSPSMYNQYAQDPNANAYQLELDVKVEEQIIKSLTAKCKLVSYSGVFDGWTKANFTDNLTAVGKIKIGQNTYNIEGYTVQNQLKFFCTMSGNA